MHARGVHLLLQAAQHSPEVQYHFLYRQWHTGYTSLDATQQAIRTHGLTHVRLTNAALENMPAVYNQHHFTVIPFTTADGGKECPNSLVEGLACGLPVLITSVSPFAYFVDAQQCGVVFEPTPAGLVAAVEQGMRQYATLSANALGAAHTYFSEEVFLHRMAQAYDDVLAHARWRKARHA
jgi:glycosyltransferase involved in cell wall biosynthesis